jgi:hypothetical protein
MDEGILVFELKKYRQKYRQKIFLPSFTPQWIRGDENKLGRPVCNVTAAEI